VRLRVSRVNVPALADARDKSKRKLAARFMTVMRGFGRYAFGLAKGCQPKHTAMQTRLRKGCPAV